MVKKEMELEWREKQDARDLVTMNSPLFHFLRKLHQSQCLLSLITQLVVSLVLFRQLSNKFRKNRAKIVCKPFVVRIEAAMHFLAALIRTFSLGNS
jgi:hypothetical protein